MYYSEADCKIIKYDMQIQEDENFCISLKDMIQKIYDDDLKKEKEEISLKIKREKLARLKAYQELKKEFEEFPLTNDLP